MGFLLWVGQGKGEAVKRWSGNGGPGSGRSIIEIQSMSLNFFNISNKVLIKLILRIRAHEKYI